MRDEISKCDSYYMKGVAAMLIVVAHYSAYSCTLYAGIVFRLLGKLGRYGVAIFFMLSGYGLEKTCKLYEGSHFGFLMRRLKHIYLPYIFVQTFLLIVILGEKQQIRHSLISVYSGIQHWYIFELIILSFIFFVSLLFKSTVKKMVFITSAISVMNIIFWHFGFDEFWYLSNYCFVLGMLIYNKMIIVVRKSILWMGLLFTAFFTTVAIYVFTENGMFHCLFKILAALLFVSVFLNIYEPFRIQLPCKNILKEIGKYSLFVYVIHLFMCDQLRLLCVENIILIWITALISVLGSVLVGKLYIFLITRVSKNEKAFKKG